MLFYSEFALWCELKRKIAQWNCAIFLRRITNEVLVGLNS